MALTRSFLKGMGLTEEQVSAIVEAHAETVDVFKTKQAELQKQLDEAVENSKNKGSDEYKEKYEKEHSDFEAYKLEQEKQAEVSKKKDAYADLLRKAGIKEKAINQIIALTNVDDFKLDKEGNLNDSENLTKSIKDTWSEFVTKEGVKGADVTNPPHNTGESVTKEQFAKMGYRAKAKLHADNPDLYATLTK